MPTIDKDDENATRYEAMTDTRPEVPMKDITAIKNNVTADAVGVARFSAAMSNKLDAKRAEGRGGWNKPDECSVESLCVMLADHVRKGDMVDIANFAMMIWNRNNPKGNV